MKKNWLLPFFLLLLSVNCNIAAQKSGEEMFKSACASCHTIKKGRLVGPDLTGVYNIRSNDWLIKFIQSSQTMIKAGDKDAVAIFNEFNKIPMPDNPFSNEQVLSIIDYIKATDGAPPAAAPEKSTGDSLQAAKAGAQPQPDSTTAQADTTAAQADTSAIQYTAESASQGKALFYGFTRFGNGASPCMSCHNINDESIMGGGKLAISLTGVYTKLGPAGIKAILSNPPFPVMKAALNNHALTENEIDQLISHFRSVSERKYAFKIKYSAASYFVVMAFVVSALLVVHTYLFYNDRKIV